MSEKEKGECGHILLNKIRYLMKDIINYRLQIYKIYIIRKNKL